MIDNLNEKELLSLRNDIEKRLKDIKDEKLDTFNRKNSVKNKTKISELTHKDRIFAIDIINNQDKVYQVDYCDIVGISKNSDPSYFNISISHKTKSFGISTCISEQDYNNHCFLVISCSSTSFFTIKPESWEIDLQKSLELYLKNHKVNYEKEVSKFEMIISNIIDDKEKINKAIDNK